MERTKYFIIGFLMIFSFATIKASYKSDIYTGLHFNDLADWKRVIDEMEGQKSKATDLFSNLLIISMVILPGVSAIKKAERRKIP